MFGATWYGDILCVWFSTQTSQIWDQINKSKLLRNYYRKILQIFSCFDTANKSWACQERPWRVPLSHVPSIAISSLYPLRRMTHGKGGLVTNWWPPKLDWCNGQPDTALNYLLMDLCMKGWVQIVIALRSDAIRPAVGD